MSTPLPADALRRRCDPSAWPFTTTADLPDLNDVVGQPRAVAAIHFGVGLHHKGYNIFAFGPPGVGKHSLLTHVFEQQAIARPAAADLCYVHNFAQPHRPRALLLPPGVAARLRDDLRRLIDDARALLAAAFESEDYRARREALADEVKAEQERAFASLQERAQPHGLTLARSEDGFAIVPVRDGEVMPLEEFHKLPEEEQRRLKHAMEVLQEELEKILYQAPRWERALRERERALGREVAAHTIAPLFEELQRAYASLANVLDHLEAVRNDIVENFRDLLPAEPTPPTGEGNASPAARPDAPVVRRYQINILVDNSAARGAPVIYEDNPTYANLVGRVEHIAQMGALVTDFTLIKPGALHRANGGYLILDARKLLQQPFAWEGLKRALQSRQIRIETPDQMTSLVSTVTLEPEPIPLDVKVAITGDRDLHYLLADADPDFNELFKVFADFSAEMDRDPQTELLYAQLIATHARREGLLPLDRAAVARVIEHAARLAEDAAKLTAQISVILDLLREADYWARQAGHDVITADDVEQALDAQAQRADRLQQQMREEIVRGAVHLELASARVGQVNGLSVIQTGNYSFGHPSRITANVWLGKGEVIDIEREVELAGPIHSKGVLILSSFLGARYAQDRPLSLSASLVFEQSYSSIEGDSASSAELYALLSALSGAPIRQALAVTGAVDQHGRVQAVGGVNQKVEGFFDLCRARGLTGEQGVLIPAANVINLMVRPDVIAAVAAGQFHIYPIATIDEGIEVLTGIPAGERGPDGRFPEGSLNARVAARLAEMAERHEQQRSSEEDEDPPPEELGPVS